VPHDKQNKFILHPIGVIRSTITNRSEAPRQGGEGAPDVWLEVDSRFSDALDGTQVGDDVIVLTFLHQSRRETLKVHPRSPSNPLTGVFATRSPDRPNPVGLHRVTVREIDGTRLRVGPMEAIEGTPVIDIKPVLSSVDDF
jgi:tRNA-Thr(GGU) m(6)t(6)A37 methyltransferase TsaA